MATLTSASDQALDFGPLEGLGFLCRSAPSGAIAIPSLSIFDARIHPTLPHLCGANKDEVAR
jgi:hypothetical protein